MLAHYIQHVPFEGLGCIGPWLENAGYELRNTRLFESARLPDMKEFDLLIVMGGPMSACDETDYPWLAYEKQFIHRAIDAGKSVLGICLGAQLIASSLGAQVYPNRHQEIGWFEVQGISHFENSIFHFPPSLKVFHWHGETFEMPSGASHLARSEGCEHQAFQIGKSVIGLQFHLETTPESAREIVSNCRGELIPSKYVQTEEEILSAKPEDYASINGVMDGLLAFIQNSHGYSQEKSCL